jgi:hypothetical protein
MTAAGAAACGGGVSADRTEEKRKTNMPLTQRSDLIDPEILLDAIKGAFPGMRMLYGTGAAVINDSLPDSSRGGDTVKVPYFDTLGEMDDIATENDALTPVKLTMSSETATVQHSGKAVELSWWSQIMAKFADPYAEVGRQFAELVRRRADKALLTVATAALPSAYVNDVSATTTLDYDTMVDSAMLWGDEQLDIALLSVHSKVYKDLRKLKYSTGQPMLVMPEDATIPRFCGVPLVVSDRNTVNGAAYESIIVKKGALAFWFNGTPHIRDFGDALADTDLTAIHMYFAAYRYKRLPISTGLSTKPGVIKIVTK